MFRVIKFRGFAVTIRARVQAQSNAKNNQKSFPTRSNDLTRLLNSLKTNQVALNVPNVLHLLDKANSANYQAHRTLIVSEFSKLCFTLMDQSMGSFGPQYLARFVNGCSLLGIFDKEIARRSLVRLRELLRDASPIPEETLKCALAVWAACLWNGLNSTRVAQVIIHKLTDTHSVVTDWSILSRLSWCVANDPLTRYDPSLKAKVDDMIHVRISPLTVREMCDLLRNDSPECTHINKAIYDRLMSEVDLTVIDKSLSDVYMRLVEAWAEMRVVPPSASVLEAVLNLGIKSGSVSLDRVMHCLAILDYPKMTTDWDPQILKDLVFRDMDWKPTLRQIATLCGSFPVLGLYDLESALFISRHLDRLVKDTCLQGPEMTELWQIGFWYSHLQHNASVTTISAINDAFRALMTKIASNMWDKQGAFVKREDMRKVDPTERAMRTVVQDSLSSLGISTMKHRHLVNTPFVVPIYLQDRDTGIFFVREGEDILSDGRLTGIMATAGGVAEAYGSRIRIFNVSEYERAFNELSKDDFMEKLLRDIQ